MVRWEEAGDAGAAFEIFIDAFEGVAGAQAALMLAREGKGRQALRYIFFQPGG